MVEWIGPCIPRGNASHAPLGRVEGDHILHGRDTRMPYEALRSRIHRRPPVDTDHMKQPKVPAFFFLPTVQAQRTEWAKPFSFCRQ